MQTVQNLRDGIWNLPSTVNSLLAATGREQQDPEERKSPTGSADGNNNGAESDGTGDNGSASAVASGPTPYGAGSVSSLTSSVDNGLLERSHAIPYALIREQWQLVLDQDASIGELDHAIDRCKELVQATSECTDERKWLVRHLIELRYRRRELLDVDYDPDAVLPETKVILGHHFVRCAKTPKHKLYCDHCSGIIWNVVQASYVCNDCSFAVHHKCIRNVIRICAHVVTTEHNAPIECICPEIGLAFQKYTCAECGTQLSYSVSTAVGCFGVELKAEKLNSIQPRLCDYSGLYYCPACHWNDTSVIPARVMNNWDFVPRKVCRASLQQIQLLLDRPVIRLEEKNPRLFNFIPRLTEIKKLRQHLIEMKKYLTACRLAYDQRLIDGLIGQRRHLMQTVDLYSVADLVAIDGGTLPSFLQSVHDTFEQHIRRCVICAAKAYICELCHNDEVLYPFDDCAVMCARCNSVSHRACQLRKNAKCGKCVRLKYREQQVRNEQLDQANGN